MQTGEGLPENRFADFSGSLFPHLRLPENIGCRAMKARSHH
ncbi:MULTISPECIES: hypothetical protein [Eikenella]|nr:MULTISPECIES: hypothetical protein [Eikenella]